MIAATYSPAETALELGRRLKKRRLEKNLTQEGLARRSGVPLGTLKKFEASGRISLLAFIHLLVALREDAALERLLEDREFQSLEQVLAIPKLRKRGRIT